MKRRAPDWLPETDEEWRQLDEWKQAQREDGLGAMRGMLVAIPAGALIWLLLWWFFIR